MGCSDSSDSSDPTPTVTPPTQPTTWDIVKSNASVNVALSTEYDDATRLNISNLGWEDGLHVSRDGLHLYAVYMPADFLSFLLNGDSVENIINYDRGPHYDMDLVTNPTGGSYTWYQSDIIYTSRANVNDDFSEWNTSDMKRHSFSEGAPNPSFNDANDTIEAMTFTSNEIYTAQNNIYLVLGTSLNPSGVGSPIDTIDTTTSCGGAALSSINTNCIEDNPHLQKISGASSWVLFFDSEDRTDGLGSHDIWYATTTDDGVTWSVPANVSTINTASQEHQPHLYHDGNDWWLYFAKAHTDNKLAIFRAKQQTLNNWDDWGIQELVISAGNTEGIGEPTLTANGDLYFVAVLKNDTGSSTDKYDADPFVALHK